MTIKVTMKAYLERVEFVRREYGSANIAKAYAVLSDDADDHEFRVAVPREFAADLAKYLATWDEVEDRPPIELTLTIPKSD